MKILIVYYSRTNVTKMIAEKLQKELKCDIEEITISGNELKGAIVNINQPLSLSKILGITIKE